MNTSTNSNSIASVLAGWDGYNRSIMNAVNGLTDEQLAFRLKDGMNSVAEIVRHIAIGRLCWFVRMDAPGSAELKLKVLEWHTDEEGNSTPVESSVPLNKSSLISWLTDSWSMVESTINSWDQSQIEEWYPHEYNGTVYAVTRQWTIFRILAHDVHHGGQLSLILDYIGANAAELIYLGGHLAEPKLMSDMKIV